MGKYWSHGGVFIDRLPTDARKKSPAWNDSRRSLVADLRPNRIMQIWREILGI
jgi:hypothetical protein